MRAKKKCDLCSPGNRAGWAVRVFIFFILRSCFCLVLSSSVKEVRREVGFVILESRSSRLTSEAQDPETQLHFVHFVGRDSCTAFIWESPTKENCTHGFCKKSVVRALDSHTS